MSVIRLPIDTKSLHCNIKNDNKIGHTATVATPLKQGNSYNYELEHIFEIPQYRNCENNIGLLSAITKNARTQIRVLSVFLFDNIAVNGIKIKTDKHYCIYVREETDPQKAQYGRIKVHYPIGFQYDDDELEIDNRSVINAISENLNGYAFIVTAFEYDTENGVLNFRVTIVGEPQIPYSKVFINEKGVGNKFVLSFSEFADHYDNESIALRQSGENVSPINYLDIMEKYCAKAMAEANEYLSHKNQVSEVKNVISDYPYALCDFAFVQDNITKYALVFFTATYAEYFSMCAKRVRFVNDFADDTILILYTNITREPKMHVYTVKEVNNFKKDIASIIYTKGSDR